jgi:hypothetical protein
LISQKNVLKKRRGAQPLVHWGYTKGLGGEEKRKRKRKSEKLITLGASQPTVQEKRVKRKKWSSSIDLEESSKHLLFRSLQIHYIIHRGTIFQTTALLERPLDHQLANNSLTEHSIT